MRLICPNCGAQYEVPDDVIPEAGRDVQCSNCGDTWFQHHANHPPAEAEAEPAEARQESPPEVPEPESAEPEPAEPEPAKPQPDDTPTAAPEEDKPAEASDEDEPAEAPDADDSHETQEQDEPEEAAPALPRRELDPAIADILRQEAEFETKERAKENRGGIETQPDLGLGADEADERSKQAQARMARLRGTSEDDEVRNEQVSAEDIDPDSRRNLLPDIDEINSSLSSDDSRNVPVPLSDDGDMVVPVKSGGFGRGFITGVLIVAIVATLYLLAPMISRNAPALEPFMTGYVTVIDSIRIMMNDLLGGVVGWFREMSAPAG